MKLSELMSTNVESISIDATVQQAAERMASADIGFLPVIHEEVISGVLTDRDITVRVVAAGLDPAMTTVGEVMSTGVPRAGRKAERTTTAVECLPEDAEVEDALTLMKERNVRRIAVHDADFRIVGIVSAADLQKAAGRTVAS